MSSYIFHVKTKEGFMLKLISEYLSNTIKYPAFRIDNTGIYLRSVDSENVILIDLKLPSTSFPKYKCTKPIVFGVNSTHFYRLLKNIKKKDSVSLFIREDKELELGITVEQNDENNDKVTTFINISYVQSEDIDLPEGYENPVIVTAKNFQKLKTLHSIGSTIRITIVGNCIRFFVNGKGLFTREVVMGENDDDEDDNDNKKVGYQQTFITHLITQLTKCAGQRSNGTIQVLFHEQLPLQLKLKTGDLGELSVYIKSKELIDMENESTENGTNEIPDMQNLSLNNE